MYASRRYKQNRAVFLLQAFAEGRRKIALPGTPEDHRIRLGARFRPDPRKCRVLVEVDGDVPPAAVFAQAFTDGQCREPKGETHFAVARALVRTTMLFRNSTTYSGVSSLMGRVADPSTVVTRRLRKISLAKGTILLKNLNKTLLIDYGTTLSCKMGHS